MKPPALPELIVGALLVAGLPSCSRAEQADACAADRQALARVVDHDQRVGGMLHEVDALAAAGNGVEAANRIDKAARPEASRVVEEAKLLQPRTRWGAARLKDLRELVGKRASSLSEYADALRSDDLEQVVTAMTAQRDLEKRAIEVQRSIGAPPDPATGQCEAP